MNAIILYLIESTFCSLLLYSVYWLFLRKETFFQINRLYLLVSILISLFIPLIPIQWIPGQNAVTMAALLEPVLITPGKGGQTAVSHLQWTEIAMVIYLTGVIIFFFHFLSQVLRILYISNRFGIKTWMGMKMVIVDSNYSPFSFFNLVFIPERNFPEDNFEVILTHERVHISQFHTADMILAQVLSILLWFNPVAWLLGKEIKNLHEYIADDGVLQTGISSNQYQQMILSESMGIQVNDLTNNFNVSLLKKRIIMMTKSKSGKWSRVKIVIALPVIIALLIFFNARSFSNASAIHKATQGAGNSDIFSSILSQGIQDKSTKKVNVKMQTDNQKAVFTVVEKLPSFPGGEEARQKFLAGNIKYPESAIKNKIQGTVFLAFVVAADGSVGDFKILRGIGGGCDEEALRVAKLMPKWNPGLEKGKPVNVQFNMPVRFALDGDKNKSAKQEIYFAPVPDSLTRKK